MSEWEEYARGAAVKVIQASKDEAHFLHQLDDVFDPAIVHRVEKSSALTLGQIACSFVNLIYGSGTGRKASRSLQEHQSEGGAKNDSAP